MSGQKLNKADLSAQATVEGFTEYLNLIKDEVVYVLVSQQKEIYADAIGIELDEFNDRLKRCKSEFLYDTVGYIDGKAVTRFNLIYLFKKTIKKLIKRIETEQREPLTYEEKIFVVEQLELQLNANL